ncbi:MAG: DUF362 domain-containing protein [Patescibacteria group bacterium]
MKAWKRWVLFILVGAMAVASLWQGLGTAAGKVSLPPSTVAITRYQGDSIYSITDGEIRDLVRQAVDLAGGLASVVKPGDVVVIKPNLVEIADFIGKRHPLPELLGGVATDRRVVRAVAELAHEAGAAKIYVMEGSAVPTAEAFSHYGYTAENLPFVDAIIPIESDSGGWQEKDSPRLVRVELPDGRYESEYYLNRRYYEADVVISVPTLKTHWDAAVTGAVKNLAIGATPANIYGGGPADTLRWPKIPHGNMEYHAFMSDFYRCKPAKFAVMDGLVGIQRGPTPNSNYGSRDYSAQCMNMRIILASKDPVALDVIEALVMGWDPQSVKYLQYLGADGVGNTDPANILIAGSKVRAVRKRFEGRRPGAGGQQFSDSEPPTLKVTGAKVQAGQCFLSLEAGKDTVRVEVYIDGRLAGFYREGFAEIAVDLKGYKAGKHEVEVAAYDRFLNEAVVGGLTVVKE